MSYRKAEMLAAQLGVPIESLTDYRPRYNIAPTDPHWIVRTKYEDREILPMFLEPLACVEGDPAYAALHRALLEQYGIPLLFASSS